MLYKIPQRFSRFSKICRATHINQNKPFFLHSVTPTFYPPFPSSIKHFSQDWLLQLLVLVFELFYVLLSFTICTLLTCFRLYIYIYIYICIYMKIFSTFSISYVRLSITISNHLSLSSHCLFV